MAIKTFRTKNDAEAHLGSKGFGLGRDGDWIKFDKSEDDWVHAQIEPCDGTSRFSIFYWYSKDDAPFL